ncbi:MAG: hypothetical protein WD045_00860 [Pirellulaceae bacterium]
MSQFTCHGCQQVFDKSSDPCFIIRLTAFLDVEPWFDESEFDDTDRDNLSSLGDTLEQLYRIDDPTLQEDQQERSYRVCRDCYQRFMADPIGGASSGSRSSFSDN